MLALFWMPCRLLAIAGAGDTVFIVGDLTADMKWAREFEQWQSLITTATQQLHKADELIKLVGAPKEAVSQFIDSVPALMQPIDDAIGLENRQQALKTAHQLYFLNSVAVQTYKDINKVGAEYAAFGQTVKRDPKRYAHYILEEAMNARFKKSVENAEAVEKSEMATQKKALAGLKAANTQAEIEIFNGIIAASKERLDLAHAKMTQAKAELDAFHKQLGVEEQRKAEADREWAQKVVTEMRQKALDAYNAQFAVNSDSGS